jgi:anti-anti-sigma factor
MSLKEFQVQDGLLTVTRSDEENRVCLALDGELDISNTQTLEAALAEAIASEKKVLIDLGQLEFLDSTGISLLVSTLGRQDAERFSFLPSRSPSVARLLEMTGLNRRMVISTETAEDRPTLPAI